MAEECKMSTQMVYNIVREINSKWQLFCSVSSALQESNTARRAVVITLKMHIN
jgi:hypothetical protein